MTSLVSLDLSTNRFSGKIPDNLPSCPRLKTLNFAKFNFAGQIPESFKNFQSLSHLSLSNSSISNLTAALEILQHCRKLTTLVLSLNFRDEAMPTFSRLQFTRLEALLIANCRLTGTIPQWLSGCTNLRLLDLSWNRMEGTIPPWFGNFQFMFYLDLSNNSFTGEIAKELTRLQSLISGNFSLKDPSVDFPFFLKKNVSHEALSYRQILSFPPTLELGNNIFTGPIWPEFGNLKGLHILDLKCNNLSGSIPSELSRMTNLETLDLSHNSLNGTIPLSLVNLSFLSEFSVAYNKLRGAIPTGGQFLTFSNSSFEGNPDLCGENGTYPRPNGNQVPDLSANRSGIPKGTIIAMAVRIGLGTVFIVYSCVLDHYVCK
ncbi:phytosulfokine receptor 1-like [Olea europaea var. sylvestris]|uniref:phytosulfokine receptor 1-like n=1 Tax=Olea europaea var. sylvestris TaxID=158386 RepID=UPI000C1D4674|nr:phytosulfokine receptor 1-like [Olea europaea var. sylvestris]